MFTPEFVKRTHEELQNLLPNADVLLGGSYMQNEATSTSDLDLYVVAPLFGWSRLKSGVAQFRHRYPDRKISIMAVPRIAYHLGLFFCSGRTIAGEVRRSSCARRTCQNNALKLALYNFLLARERGSSELLMKSAQQGALAAALLNSSCQLPLSNNELLKDLQARGVFSCISLVLQYKLRGGESLPFKEVCKGFAQELVSLVELSHQTFEFDWRSWGLYNSRFLPQGEWLFLFSNPATMIINRLRRAVIQPETWYSLKSWAKRYVFPVIMY